MPRIPGACLNWIVFVLLGILYIGIMIRFAQERDIPRILELLVQVNMVHHVIRPDIFNGPATKYSALELSGMISHMETEPVFVYVDDNERVLGYAMCQMQQITGDSIRTDIKTLYLDDLCVDEACRGRHIGRELYMYVRDYARSVGCYNLTLNVWEGNDSALAFYRRLGMKPQKYGMEEII